MSLMMWSPWYWTIQVYQLHSRPSTAWLINMRTKLLRFDPFQPYIHHHYTLLTIIKQNHTHLLTIYSPSSNIYLPSSTIYSPSLTTWLAAYPFTIRSPSTLHDPSLNRSTAHQLHPAATARWPIAPRDLPVGSPVGTRELGAVGMQRVDENSGEMVE